MKVIVVILSILAAVLACVLRANSILPLWASCLICCLCGAFAATAIRSKD
ncbi:MAG: hypothetical protein IKI57_03120 [Clostridia bacterium]|nr:hypothetical protein [Clostridia bacterium]